jgi:integrase
LSPNATTIAVSRNPSTGFIGRSLIRSTDIVPVAELMGHSDLETTRLYTLPTDADVEAAVARLPADQ